MNHREKEKLFKTLFDAYYERLYYAAATILGDQMVAEDIIEDVFEHYWERINDDAIYNSPSYAYFLRMVYNRCGDHVRHQKVHNRFRDYYISHHTEGPMHDDELLEERIAIIQKVRKEMPEKTRRIMDLCYFENKQYKEVAEIVGLSKDSVRMHIIKALGLLRDAFSVKKRKRP